MASSEGEQLGRYHLVRKLATGGMAEVFLAKVMGPGGFEKSMVIKRILPNLAKDPEFVAMFLQEARLAAQFGHPAVVQIFDFGEVNGSYFLAMEFVDGPNLRNILRASPGRRISPVVGARVIEEACEGLAYVHEFADASGKPLGLMHCDVSSDNLMIARNGAVKVVDFGVATGAGQGSNSAPGTVKGKIAYMPPEQIIGEADLRSDVYALGVILYELAAGARPYEAPDDQQLLAAIIKTDPVPLLSRKPDLPREYANIVEKAMSKNLSARFQNCRELAAALDEFIQGTGQRVGTRQLAALATQFNEAQLKETQAKETPEGPPLPGTAVLATPKTPTRAPAGVISPPKGAPAAAPRKNDPFAAFGTAMSKQPPAPIVEAPPAQASRADELFSEFFSDLEAPDPEPKPAPSPPPPRAPEPKAEPKPVPKVELDDDDSGMKVTIGVGRAVVSVPLRGASAPMPPLKAPPPTSPTTPGPTGSYIPSTTPRPGTSGLFVASTTPRPGSSGLFVAPVRPPEPAPPAPKPPAPAPAPAPAKVLTTAESRAALVMADASHMRLFEVGPTLASIDELEAVRRAFERDEALYALVRFPSNAHRLLQAKGAEELVFERVAGAVEGLLLAEAWGALATLLERLRAATDKAQRQLFELALSHLATADQARLIMQRLREAPPTDVEGLGRLLPFFGGAFALTWLTNYENLDLPASRDAVLPGLAGLAGLNPAPFLERLQPKRPRRLMELAYCLEKGRVPDRQRLTRELLTRLDSGRKREVLTGLARAGSDEAFKIVLRAITEAEGPKEDLEATRVHAIQLLGKHFPERVFEALQPLLTPQNAVAFSDPERRAMWVAIGHSTVPAAFEVISAELMLRAPILGRAKADARKVDVLEAVAVMKTAPAVELLRKLASDTSLSDSVRAAADRHYRSAELVNATTPTHSGESRRWDRNPITWRDVLLDLAALAAGSRLVEVDSATFDVAFARLSKCLAALLPAGTQAVVTCAPALAVNGQVVNEGGSDLPVGRAVKAFQSRGIAGFTFTRQPARAELEQLVRWLAAGGAAEGVETPSITLALASGLSPKPAPMPLPVPLMSDFSREAMTRAVELVLGFRGWFSQKKLNPRAELPNVAPLLSDLAAAATSRSVRFAGLLPHGRGRDAELFHSVNVMMLSLLFGAELNLQQQQLVDLATYAFFCDVGNLELKDEVLERAGQLSEADQQEVAAARRAAARLPFTRLGDKPGAVSWASVVLEQEVDSPGGTGEQAKVGLMGSLVALARAYETLTTPTASRPAMTSEEALEVLTQKVAHRFRPELLSLFARFAKRLSTRALGR